MEKKKLEFSKIMVIGIFLTWVAGILISAFKPEAIGIMDFINPAMLTICGGYILKAGVENIGKITNWGKPEEEDPEGQ